MKNQKRYKFKCEGCEKMKSSMPFEELKVNRSKSKLLFCSHECFIDYTKFYLRAIGYSVVKRKKSDKKDTVTRRMARGLKVMYEKIANSDYVKSIQEANNDPNPESMLPKGLDVKDDYGWDMGENEKTK